MSLNAASSTFRRSAADEASDTKQVHQNIRDQSWKSWPNEAGFVGLEEHRGPIPLKVTGSIPSWAAGSLYRTGPGASQIETDRGTTHYVSHWFDGYGHTHKFDILPAQDDEAVNGNVGGGSATVTYSSRRQSEKMIESIKKKGWRTGTSFAQKADPCVGIFAKAMSAFDTKSGPNNNVTVLLNVPGASSRKSTSPPGEKKTTVNGTTTTSGHRTGTSSLFIGTDNATLLELDPSTLEPIGTTINQSSLNPDLKGPLSCAHAQRDPQTGDWFNFNLELGKTIKYRIFRSNAATGTTDVLATISDAKLRPAYIHSFFLTENYVVLCVPTAHYGLNGVKIVWEKNVLDAIKPFDENTEAEWMVVDRRHGKGLVARFSTPAGYFFHSINAFEETVKDKDGGEHVDLCLDYVHYDNTDVLFGFYHDIILDRNNATAKHWTGQVDRGQRTTPRLVRYRYSLPADIHKQESRHQQKNGDSTSTAGNLSSTAEEAISIPGPHIGELPTINPLYACKPYRYAYTVSTRGLSTLVDCIAKTDLQTREVTIWSGPEGHSPGEAIFVPRPSTANSSKTDTNGMNGHTSASEGQALAEDDGVLLSVVLDGKKGTSYLLCLDARSMKEVGRAEVDFAIGIGFHGAFAAEM